MWLTHAERVSRASAELVRWVRHRCKRLWASAAQELHATYGPDLHEYTRETGPLYFALLIAGELSPQRCAELLHPFAELEQARLSYRMWRQSALWCKNRA